MGLGPYGPHFTSPPDFFLLGVGLGGEVFINGFFLLDVLALPRVCTYTCKNLGRYFIGRFQTHHPTYSNLLYPLMDGVCRL